jgi:hypothetical protein
MGLQMDSFTLLELAAFFTFQSVAVFTKAKFVGVVTV